MLRSSTSINWSPAVSIGLLVFTSIFATASQAHDGTWTITRLTGDVRLVEDGVLLASISERMALRPGTGIRTGGNGRIMLTHAGESMLISPDSSITIPDTFKKTGYSTLLQKRGTVLFEVEKDQMRPFQVLTPYLAAAVKGTQFSVTLMPGESRVEVVEGRVEVTEFRSGQAGLVSAGQSAVVKTASNGLRVTGGGFIQPIRQGVPMELPDIPDVDAGTYIEASLRESAPSPQTGLTSSLQMQGMPSTGASNFSFDSSNGLQAVGRTSKWSLPEFEWSNQVSIPIFFGFAVAFGVAMRNWSNIKKKMNKEKKKRNNHVS